MERFYVRPHGKIAHLYDPLDSRMPMRAACGHKEYPQNIIQASSCAQYPTRSVYIDDPIYCPKCLGVAK